MKAKAQYYYEDLGGGVNADILDEDTNRPQNTGNVSCSRMHSDPARLRLINLLSEMERDLSKIIQETISVDDALI